MPCLPPHPHAPAHTPPTRPPPPPPPARPPHLAVLGEHGLHIRHARQRLAPRALGRLQPPLVAGVPPHELVVGQRAVGGAARVAPPAGQAAGGAVRQAVCVRAWWRRRAGAPPPAPGLLARCAMHAATGSARGLALRRPAGWLAAPRQARPRAPRTPARGERVPVGGALDVGLGAVAPVDGAHALGGARVGGGDVAPGQRARDAAAVQQAQALQDAHHRALQVEAARVGQRQAGGGSAQ